MQSVSTHDPVVIPWQSVLIPWRPSSHPLAIPCRPSVSIRGHPRLSVAICVDPRLSVAIPWQPRGKWRPRGYPLHFPRHPMTSLEHPCWNRPAIIPPIVVRSSPAAACVRSSFATAPIVIPLADERRGSGPFTPTRQDLGGQFLSSDALGPPLTFHLNGVMGGAGLARSACQGSCEIL